MSEYDVTCCDPSAVVAEEKHHPYGPSRWPALAVCPHYVGKPGGADAQKGIICHALFARAAKGLIPPDSEEEEKGDLFERNAIKLGRRALEEAGDDPEKVMVEETVVCPPPPGVQDFFEDGEIFGRMDLAWFDGDGELHVKDLKLVENPDRDYRPQLVPYAYGLAREWDVTPRTHLHTVYVDTMNESVDTMEWEELEKSYRILRAKVYAASKETAGALPVQSGWCQLCAKFEGCAAPRAVAETVAEGALADLAKPAEWAALAPPRRAQLCVLADTVEKWAKAVKALAAADAKAGVAIEDPENGIYYGLQEKRGTLVLDTDKAWEAAQAHGILRGQFVACLKVDAKALKERLVAWMKVKEADALLETCGTRGKGTVSFVRKGVK